jgi:acetyl esterase
VGIVAIVSPGVSRVIRWTMLPLVSLVAAPGPAAGQAQLQDVTVMKDIQYRTVGGLDLFMDAYLPRDGGKNPAIVAIHGGGFSRGFRTDMDFTCRVFALRDYTCFTIDYRLAPNFDPGIPGKPIPTSPRLNGPGYPAQVDDVKAAIEFVRSNPDRFSVDPERVATLGESAGGTLSAMIGADSQKTHSTGWEVAAAISWSGAVAFSPAVERRIEGTTEEGSTHSLPTYIFGQANPPDPDPAKIREADPLTHLGKDSTPFFLGNSSDELVPETWPQTFSERAQQLGVPVVLDIFPGTEHGQGIGPQLRLDTLQFTEQYVRGFKGFQPSQAQPQPSSQPASPTGRGARTGSGSSLPLVILALVLVLVAGIVAIAYRGRGR